jgi:hypothetical protein
MGEDKLRLEEANGPPAELTLSVAHTWLPEYILEHRPLVIR